MQSLLGSVGSYGVLLARWILVMNMLAAAVLAAAYLLDRLLERRVGAGLRVWLYGAVLARVLIPPAWRSPLGIVTAWAPWPAAGAGAPAAAPAAAAAATVAGAAGGAGGTTGGLVAHWPALVPVAYGAGVLVLAVLWARDAARLRALARSSRAVPMTAGPGGPPVLAHETAGPMLLGLRRPRVIVPEWLCAPAEAGRLGWVLAHERAHADRLDQAAAPLVHALAVALWPVAAVWLAASRVRALMEHAADERLVRGKNGGARAAYARVLLRVADAAGAAAADRRAAAGAGALPFAAALRSRLVALSFARRWPTALAAPVLIVLTAALVACGGVRGVGTGAAGGPDPIDPSAAASYPLVSFQIALFRLDGPVTFEELMPGAPAAGTGDSPDRPGGAGYPTRGALIVSPAPARGSYISYEPSPGDAPGVIPWARMIPTERMGGLFGALSARAGAEHVTSPAVLARPGQRAVIEAGSADKAGGPTGANRFTVGGEVAGGGVRVSFEHAVVSGGSAESVSSFPEPVAFAAGSSMVWLEPPAAAAGGAWRLLVLTPELIRGPAGYPFQTFTVEDPAPGPLPPAP